MRCGESIAKAVAHTRVVAIVALEEDFEIALEVAPADTFSRGSGWRCGCGVSKAKAVAHTLVTGIVALEEHLEVALEVALLETT